MTKEGLRNIICPIWIATSFLFRHFMFKKAKIQSQLLTSVDGSALDSAFTSRLHKLEVMLQCCLSVATISQEWLIGSGPNLTYRHYIKRNRTDNFSAVVTCIFIKLLILVFLRQCIFINRHLVFHNRAVKQEKSKYVCLGALY